MSQPGGRMLEVGQSLATEDGRPSGLALGARFGDGEAEAWVKKLDQMDNEQLADVLGFIIGKLCKNRP